MNITERLFSLRDDGYREFQCKLIPNVAPETVLGIRIPALRHLAKELRGTPDESVFLAGLPHNYHDEYNLHGLLISACKDYDKTVYLLKNFLPYVDNWATCDLIRPCVFCQNQAQLLPNIKDWISADHAYTVRFGLEMLMVHYLGEDSISEYLRMAANVVQDEYYVRMMVAWFFATALTAKFDQTIVWLENRQLSPWIHNKAIQKAVESRQISADKKVYLKALRVRPGV